MKCPQCGYVSFDDVAVCKRCGAAVEEGGGVAGEAETAPDLQDRLFASSLDDAGDEEAAKPAPGGGTFSFADEAAPGPEDEPVELPAMHIDYDPAADPDDAADPAGDGYHYVDVPDDPAQEVIDDNTDLPDDLWLEESAGFLLRLGAFAIDGIILAAMLGTFVLGALVALGPGEYGMSVFGSPGVFIAFYLLALLLSLGYFTFFLGWIGRTPGKALLKLDVRRSDGAPMTYTRAFLRWAGYLVSLTFAGLGFFWVLFDERKRGWHDYLSGTWVQDRRHEE